MSEKTPDPDDIFEDQTPNKLGGSFDDIDHFDFDKPSPQTDTTDPFNNYPVTPASNAPLTGGDTAAPDKTHAGSRLDIDSIGSALDELPTPPPPSSSSNNQASPSTTYPSPILVTDESSSQSDSDVNSQSTSMMAGIAFLAVVAFLFIGLFVVAIFGVQYLSGSSNQIADANAVPKNNVEGQANFDADAPDELDREIEDLRNEFNVNDAPNNFGQAQENGGWANGGNSPEQQGFDNFANQPGGIAPAQLAPVNRNEIAPANGRVRIQAAPINIQPAIGNAGRFDGNDFGNAPINQPAVSTDGQQLQFGPIATIEAASGNANHKPQNGSQSRSTEETSPNKNTTARLLPPSPPPIQFASATIDGNFNIVSNQEIDELYLSATDAENGFVFELVDPTSEQKTGTPVDIDNQNSVSLPLLTSQFEIPKENVAINFDSGKRQLRVTVSPSRPEKEILTATLQDLTQTITELDYKTLGSFRFPRDGGRVIDRIIFTKFAKALADKTMSLKQLFNSEQFLREQHQRLANFDKALVEKASEIGSGASTARSTKLKNIQNKRTEIANAIAELKFAERNVNLFHETIDKIARDYAEIYIPQSAGLFPLADVGGEPNQQLIQSMRLEVDGISAPPRTINSRSFNASNTTRVSPAVELPSVQPN